VDKNRLEHLLSLSESSILDFKSEIDLDSKRGKAKFLVEVLELANSPEKPAYLILGIEDKTKKPVGISDEITEERLQKVIADNCRPPLKCVFENVAYMGKRIGILIVQGDRRPYFLKKDLGFQDENGKQQIYSDKMIFVKRGSTGDTATIDEITEMILDRQTNGFETNEELYEELNSLSSNLFHINNSIDRLNDKGKRERAIEYLFIGIVSGLGVGFLQALGLDWEIYISGIFVSTFWISVLASALKIVRFGWMRSVLISLIISVAFVTLSVLLDRSATQVLITLGFPSTLVLVWSGIKGMVGGITAAFLGRGEYEYD